MLNKKVIAWWSGGITSAVACWLSIQLFGKENVRVIMIDTRNEDEDTYRFKKDCEKWYGQKIEVISGIKLDADTCAKLEWDYEYVDVGFNYTKIQDVWRRFKSLNVASGAICSAELKRAVRIAWQKTNTYDYQVFGFEFDKKEMNRALSLTANYPSSKSIYPLLMFGYDKETCIKLVREIGIEIPRSYQYGFKNNNCQGTGCVQGGIGYWQKMKQDFPEKFEAMADVEHELTALKGQPVSMLKDQSNAAKQTVKETGLKWKAYVFLRKHPDYPEVKCIDEMPLQKVEPLFECNGFCGSNDLNGKNKTEDEINFESEDDLDDWLKDISL